MKRLLLITIMMLMSGCLSKLTNQVCFNNKCVDVEIASTDDERVRGLQSRPSLGSDQGMLFVFPSPGKHSFWMKNTLIALDIIWMDHARRVVYIEENARPCKIAPCPAYVPPEDALYVLELNGNSAGALGIKKGSVLDFRLNL
jgi:uncharacterized protein